MRRTTVADICLYGTSPAGAGWLAKPVNGNVVGDSKLRPERTFTTALWQAAEALRSAGVTAGEVAIYAPGGTLMAYAPVTRVPTFGDLKWQPAIMIEISVETIKAAAAAQEGT